MDIKGAGVFFDIKQIEDGDDQNFTFKGYASTFGNKDRGNDIVEAGAFTKTLAEAKRSGRPVPVLWQHQMDSPIGVLTVMKEDQKGLYVEGKLPKSSDFVRGTVKPQLDVGSVNAMSIGFLINDFGFEGDVRKIKEVSLLEVSLVTIPMNAMAEITDIKSAAFEDLSLASRDRDWDFTDVDARLKAWADVQDEPNEQYKSAFLVFDNSEDDAFKGCKLPIADVINGQLKAIPRGIFAAAGALSGVKSGVDLPDESKSVVIKNVNRYYEKMGLESPFTKSGFRIDEVNSHNARELEALLSSKSGVILAKGCAKKVASLVSSQKPSQREVDEVPQKAKAGVLEELNKIINIMESRK